MAGYGSIAPQGEAAEIPFESPSDSVVSASALALPLSSDPTSEAAEAGTLSPMGRTTAGQSGAKKKLVGTTGVLVVTVVALIAVVLKRPSISATDEKPVGAADLHTAVEPAPTPASPAPTPASPQTAAPEPSTIASAQVAALPATTIHKEDPSAKKGKGSTPSPMKQPAAAQPAAPIAATPPPTPTPVAQAKPGCDPNFTFDDQGRKALQTRVLLEMIRPR